MRRELVRLRADTDQLVSVLKDEIDACRRLRTKDTSQRSGPKTPERALQLRSRGYRLFRTPPVDRVADEVADSLVTPLLDSESCINRGEKYVSWLDVRMAFSYAHTEQEKRVSSARAARAALDAVASSAAAVIVARVAASFAVVRAKARTPRRVREICDDINEKGVSDSRDSTQMLLEVSTNERKQEESTKVVKISHCKGRRPPPPLQPAPVRTKATELRRIKAPVSQLHTLYTRSRRLSNRKRFDVRRRLR